MELPILAHVEEASKGTLRHLFNCLLDGNELVLDERVVPRFLVQAFENLQSFIVAALHNKPTWGFREVGNRGENDHGKENLKGQRKAPGDLLVSNE